MRGVILIKLQAFLYIYLFILCICVACACVKVNMEKLVLFLHIWVPGIKLLPSGLVACVFNDGTISSPKLWAFFEVPLPFSYYWGLE